MKKVLVFIFFFFITFINVYAKEEYLKDILIDGVSISDFSTDKTEYELTVDSLKDTIKITYLYDTNKYIGSGSYGDISLKYGVNKLSYTLKNKEDSSNTLTYNISITRTDNRSNINTLSSLSVAGISVKLTDELTYNVSVDNTLTTCSITAVLTSDKSNFVSGYGERTGNNKVNLTGETTKVEIKVKAENESIKTYVINIIKKEYKSNDATLKSLKLDNIDIDFKSSVYEYNIVVPNEITKTKVDAVVNNSKATVNKLNEIDLVEGINNIVVSVKAEDGSLKEYKINITREEEKVIVDDITIDSIEFDFDSSIYEYNIETELDILNFNISLNSKTATYEILNNKDLENKSIVSIVITDDDKTLTYKFNIIKDEVEEINNEDITSQEKSFLEKYEMYIGLGVFGLGLLSLLIAILTKPKNSQIM